MFDILLAYFVIKDIESGKNTFNLFGAVAFTGVCVFLLVALLLRIGVL